MDTNSKVEETVIYGSVYESLYARWIRLEDILEYLLDTKPEDDFQRKRMSIAYRIVCIYTKRQFIRGDHFICLTENNDYMSIYSLSFPQITIEEASHDTNLTLTQKVQTNISLFVNKSEYQEYTRFLYVLCDVTPTDFIFKHEDLMIIAATRSFKNLSEVIDEDFYILAADYLTVLGLNSEETDIFTALIERSFYLKSCAPAYWESVAYPLYRNYIEARLNCNELKGWTKSMILMYNTCFPNFFSEEWMNKSENYFYLTNLKPELLAYLLGYPIHKYVPNQETMKLALDQLETLGFEEYCQKKKKIEKQNVANPENVYLEKIEEFNSFDVVSYYDSTNHLFRFTRSEFDTILQEKKNFYTGELLPFFVLEKIRCRRKIAQKYNLPEAKTLSDLLENPRDYKYDKESSDDLAEYISLDEAMNGYENTDDDSDENTDPDEETETEIIMSDEESHILVRIENEEGEESFFKFNVPEDMEEDQLEDYIKTILARRGLHYLNREHVCICRDR